jgi:hypothetical protein
MSDDGELLVVWDTRGGIAPTDTHLSGLERELYLACDRCASDVEVATTVGRSRGRPVSVDTVTETLARLMDAGLVFTDGRRYLALARSLGDRPVPSSFLLRFALDLAAT